MEFAVRITGVVVALLATIVATPAATTYIAKSTAHAVKTRARQARTAFGRVGQHLRRWITGDATMHGVTSTGSGMAMAGVSHASGNVTWNVEPLGELNDRVGRLEQRVIQLRDQADANERAIARESSERVAAQELLAARIVSEVASIREGLAKVERDAVRVDTVALPAVGLGILLSGIPDLIAQSAVAAVILMTGSVAYLVWAAVRAFKPPKRLTTARTAGSPE